METVSHIFRFCDLAKVVWRDGLLGFNSDFNREILFCEWLSNNIQLLYSMEGVLGIKLIGFIATIWEIWLARNAKCFRNQPCFPGSILASISEAITLNSCFQNKGFPYLGFLHPPEISDSPPPGFYAVSIGA